MIDVRKRPMCWLAIGFLLIICVLMLGRSEIVIPLEEKEEVLLEGTVVTKEYKESVYGGYWQVALKKVRVAKQHTGKEILEKNKSFSSLDKENIVKDESVSSLDKENIEKDESAVVSLEGKYLCQITQGEAEIRIGQRILLKARYASWERPTNEGQFDTEQYYVSQGILGQFKKGELLKTGSDFSLLKENMWRLRQHMQTCLVKQLGNENGGLIGAMLLGEKSDLNQEDKSLYQRNGISHILAISGLHLSLLGMGIYKVLLKIMPGKKQAAYTCIVIMSLYCVFTGNSISTIRATIMFALSLVATILGRSYDSLSALGLTAIIQLFMNPYVLNNSGFLLSFLAVIGVTFLSPRLQQLFSCKRKWEKSLCVSLSATLTTLPVVLANYGTYPWYSVFLNLLILPPMSVLLLCAILLLVVSGGIGYESIFAMQEVLGNAGWSRFILQNSLMNENSIFELCGFLISNFLKMVIQGILNYIEFCCEVFEKLILQEGYIGAPGWLAIVIYGSLLLVVISERMVPSNFLRKLLLLCAISILTMKFYTGLEITMLDVGQGDGVVIRNSNGNVYLSDCGSSSVSKVGEYRLLPFLKYKGYGRIKGIFLSHMDEDHKNGILELLEKAKAEHISIEYLFLPESVLAIPEDEQAVEELEILANENGTKIVYLSREEELVDGNLYFTCLYPEAIEVAEENNPEVFSFIQGSDGIDRNNSSLVLLMQYHKFDMLFTGDVEAEGEKDIVNFAKKKKTNVYDKKQISGDDISQVENAGIDVLKVSHHGSSGSSCEEFLEVFQPNISLISCGKNNSYGHPHEETIERLTNSGTKILTTVECGAITVKVNGERMEVVPYIEKNPTR